MNFIFDNSSPIYLQIAKIIEDGILNGYLREESMIPSTTEISSRHRVNPATIAKGFNILVNDEIIYKKRGIGMFVQKGSKEKIYKKRKEDFTNNFIKKMMNEAVKLKISKEEVIQLINNLPKQEEITGL